MKKLRYWLTLLLCLCSPLKAFADQALLEKPAFQTFLQKMVNKYHFDKNDLVSLFLTVQPQPQVSAHMNHPLEKETWKLYQRVFINDNYIKEGSEFRKKHHASLVEAEKRYGVPGSIIIGTLGVETKFGTHPGGYRVVDALSHLAFNDQPRAKYFQMELEQFLILSRENHLNPATVQGSYAGAIGAPQFMPSSYRSFAVSLSADKGHVDLNNSFDDSIASIANYYHKHGWKSPNIVAIPATVSGDKYLKLFNPDGKSKAFSSAKLAQYGIKPDRPLPRNDKVKLIALDGKDGLEYWIVFPDFDVIKRYNPSNLYAMAVYQLGQSILQHDKKDAP